MEALVSEINRLSAANNAKDSFIRDVIRASAEGGVVFTKKDMSATSVLSTLSHGQRVEVKPHEKPLTPPQEEEPPCVQEEEKVKDDIAIPFKDDEAQLSPSEEKLASDEPTFTTPKSDDHKSDVAFSASPQLPRSDHALGGKINWKRYRLPTFPVDCIEITFDRGSNVSFTPAGNTNVVASTSNNLKTAGVEPFDCLIRVNNEYDVYDAATLTQRFHESSLHDSKTVAVFLSTHSLRKEPSKCTSFLSKPVSPTKGSGSFYYFFAYRPHCPTLTIFNGGIIQNVVFDQWAKAGVDIGMRIQSINGLYHPAGDDVIFTQISAVEPGQLIFFTFWKADDPTSGSGLLAPLNSLVQDPLESTTSRSSKVEERHQEMFESKTKHKESLHFDNARSLKTYLDSIMDPSTTHEEKKHQSHDIVVSLVRTSEKMFTMEPRKNFLSAVHHPALQAAGVVPGDRLIAVNNHYFFSAHDVSGVVQSFTSIPVGETFSLTVRRREEEEEKLSIHGDVFHASLSPLNIPPVQRIGFYAVFTSTVPYFLSYTNNPIILHEDKFRIKKVNISDWREAGLNSDFEILLVNGESHTSQMELKMQLQKALKTGEKLTLHLLNTSGSAVAGHSVLLRNVKTKRHDPHHSMMRPSLIPSHHPPHQFAQQSIPQHQQQVRPKKDDAHRKERETACRWFTFILIVSIAAIVGLVYGAVAIGDSGGEEDKDRNPYGPGSGISGVGAFLVLGITEFVRRKRGVYDWVLDLLLSVVSVLFTLFSITMGGNIQYWSSSSSTLVAIGITLFTLFGLAILALYARLAIRPMLPQVTVSLLVSLSFIITISLSLSLFSFFHCYFFLSFILIFLLAFPFFIHTMFN